ALDLGSGDLRQARDWMAAMRQAGECPAGADALAVQADARWLPFPDAAFDRVIVSEVLEHIAEDITVLREVRRVLRPGGTIAVTVPRWFPERICWLLSEEYHSSSGGHVRVYRPPGLCSMRELAGFRAAGQHHAHALHCVYCGDKCAV